ncbi:ATP-grasp domain-containing protein [Brachybacterium aquaticum]|uniref:Carbamoyl-phosphate synthase large subunit n=1 Tax=Brachybacterium aquaticum TaxID=1432564 RepID=A0A841AI43_9MICO|nr:ATP-grasp domain-containing protein [Brachybacterium aquaticum]MBB5832724.1 carbamoyl-phosphate synthase large subunit [Brachybacterium aquaticum]
MKIVISSAGRRAHYVEWFREALGRTALSGEVIAMEYRLHSPSTGLADRAVPSPAYNSPEYPEALREWCRAERPDLFLSLNDYELQILSGGLAEEMRSMGCRVAVLGAELQPIVLDKHRMATALAERGIPTPRTVLGSEVDRIRSSARSGDRFVVKHRFGSGSTGLRIVEAEALPDAVEQSAQTALGADGLPAADGPAATVVQEALPGPEYGVDGVFDVDGRGELLGVLARRKDLMRGGDTDVATTVAPEPFHAAIREIGAMLRPSAAIDVDLRDNADGEPQVIDINPRLGGGYPFCHRAGADLPAALIRSAVGLEPDPELLRYRVGVTSARREEFTVVAAPR